MKSTRLYFSLILFLVFSLSATPLLSITQEQLMGYAINQSDAALANILIKYGDSEDVPVLNRAMVLGDYFAVFMLIEYGVDINSRGKGWINHDCSQTVLEMAIERNDCVLVEYFLLNSADPNNLRKGSKVYSISPHRQSFFYTTAIYDAIVANRMDILSLFAKYGVNFNNVCSEKTSNYETQYSYTPIQLALKNENYEIVSLLLSIGVDI